MILDAPANLHPITTANPTAPSPILQLMIQALPIVTE